MVNRIMAVVAYVQPLGLWYSLQCTNAFDTIFFCAERSAGRTSPMALNSKLCVALVAWALAAALTAGQTCPNPEEGFNPDHVVAAQGIRN